ncbi:MAG: hypothetical protein KBG84_02795 [Planctomycetes bacterium]|nr:hypothetical protein [Planctomycetota bacterium]
MRTVAILAMLCFAGALRAGVVLTVEMPSGSWEILPATQCEPYEGAACFSENWKPLVRGESDAVISWFLPKASTLHGRPISVLVLSGEDTGWTRDEVKSREWLSCRGEGQRPYMIVCAPDVTQLHDPNSAKYALWLAVEYADGARLPFYGDGFPSAKQVGGSPANSLEPWAARLPANYKLEGPLSREGNVPKRQRTGHGELIKRETAPEFKGRAWAWDKWLGVEKGESAALISWPPAPAQADDGKPVRYFLFFGKLEAAVFNDSASRVAQWMGGRGDGQWEFYFECAPDVTQVLDLNKDKYRVFLAVEFESGKRMGYQGLDCPRVETYSEAMLSRVARNAYRMPVNYGRPRPPEMVDIRDRVQVYLKEGRSWTSKNTVKIFSTGESVTYSRVEILKVGDNEVEYRVTELGADQKPLPGSEPQLVKLPLKVPKSGATPAPVAETITVKAGTFECMRSEGDFSGTKTFTWTSQKFTGLVVKQVSRSDTLESTQELVEFKE